MKNFNQLNKDIISAISLFAEFGERGHYVRKGKIIIVNDVTDPESEGIFLARCARHIARNKGVAYAYEWALEQFTNNSYHRLNCKNTVYPTMRQLKAQTRRIELGLA